MPGLGIDAKVAPRSQSEIEFPAAARGSTTAWLLWRVGLVYVFGIFLTYLGLGLGLLLFASALGQTHWVGRAAAVGAVTLGLLSIQEGLVPEWGLRLAVPAGLHHRASLKLGLGAAAIALGLPLLTTPHVGRDPAGLAGPGSGRWSPFSLPGLPLRDPGFLRVSSALPQRIHSMLTVHEYELRRAVALLRAGNRGRGHRERRGASEPGTKG